MADKPFDFHKAAVDDVVEQAEAENARLREKLIQIERQTNMSRTWRGVDGWRHVPMPAHRVEKIARLCKEGLEPKEPSDG